MQIAEIIEIGQDSAAGRILLQVIQHTIDLIEHPLGILMLHAELITIGLADGAVLIRPTVPNVAAQLVDVVGLFLPDPQQLIDAGAVIRPAQRHDGKFFFQVISVNNAEALDRVRGCAVRPVRTHLAVGVPDALGEDLPTSFNVYGICVAHLAASFGFGRRRNGQNPPHLAYQIRAKKSIFFLAQRRAAKLADTAPAEREQLAVPPTKDTFRRCFLNDDPFSLHGNFDQIAFADVQCAAHLDGKHDASQLIHPTNTSVTHSDSPFSVLT